MKIKKYIENITYRKICTYYKHKLENNLKKKEYEQFI